MSKLSAILLSALILGIADSAFSKEITKPFDEQCFYAHEGRPDWTPIEDVKMIIPMGVEMNRQGNLHKLVPKSRLAKALAKTTSPEEWYSLLASAPRRSFQISTRALKKNQKTPFDFSFDTQQLIVFRLFNEAWDFAPDPITTDHEIPILANGFKTHASPFYHKARGTPSFSKIASLGIIRDPARIKEGCTYKYDLNVDVTTGHYKTRIIIDPESTAGSGGIDP